MTKNALSFKFAVFQRMASDGTYIECILLLVVQDCAHIEKGLHLVI